MRAWLQSSVATVIAAVGSVSGAAAASVDWCSVVGGLCIVLAEEVVPSPTGALEEEGGRWQ